MKDNQHFQEVPSAPAQSGAGSRPRILVVEDDNLLRQLNTEVLSRSGYAVDAAEDGAVAWQALNADSYDLVITDNKMPNVSGVELLKKMHAAGMLLPVIMATTTVPEAEFARCPWLEPAAKLIKPYTVESMLRTVEQVLGGAPGTAVAPRRRPANPPHRVLVVDEDGDLRRLYAEVLEGPGLRVDVADDGAAGWEALQAAPYNLLITEYELHKVSGLELVRRLRAAPIDLPVIIAASRMPMDKLWRSPALRLSATLLKPFDLQSLLDTVGRVLRAGDRQDDRDRPNDAWRDQP